MEKGEVTPTKKDVTIKLEAIWGIGGFKIVSLGKWVYHVLFYGYHATVMLKGVVHVKLGIYRSLRWYLGFKMLNYKQTTS